MWELTKIGLFVVFGLPVLLLILYILWLLIKVAFIFLEQPLGFLLDWIIERKIYKWIWGAILVLAFFLLWVNDVDNRRDFPQSPYWG